MGRFLPKEYFENIYKINYKKLLKKNIKCLLFDLDNTCIPYKDKEPTKEVIDLFGRLKKMGFKVIVFTNAPKKRTIPFQKLGIECNYLSKKPLKTSFFKIIKKYNYELSDVCIIGDQLFTDIYGGNRVGIYTILVDPLSQNDFIFTKIFRGLEILVIKKYTKKGVFTKGEYDD